MKLEAIRIVEGGGIRDGYKHYYYCPSCRAWILKEKAVWRGRKLKLPYCPLCGRRLRTKPRFYRIHTKAAKRIDPSTITSDNRSNRSILYYSENLGRGQSPTSRALIPTILSKRR